MPAPSASTSLSFAVCALVDAKVTTIARDACEIDDLPDDTDSVCLTVEDLRLIVRRNVDQLLLEVLAHPAVRAEFGVRP